MRDLPPQAYQLLLEQDLQLKQLRTRVQSLSKKKRSTVSTADQSVMTGSVIVEFGTVVHGTCRVTVLSHFT